MISFLNQAYDQQKLIAELEDFSFRNGISFDEKADRLHQTFSFELSQAKLGDLNKVLSASLRNSANINISLIGNLNIQKQLGAMYSAWDSKSTLSISPSDNVFTKIVDRELLKNKEAYWQTVLAALIYCDSSNLNQLNFRLSEDKLSCVLNSHQQAISDGDIAELKANFLDYLNFKQSTSAGLIELLNITEFDDNLAKLQELITYLPQISIEKVSQEYHQLLSDNGPRLRKVAEDGELDNDVFSDEHQILVKAQDFGHKLQYLALYLNVNYLEFCAIVQCQEQTQLVYQFITKDPVLILFKFELGSSEKLVDKVVKQIIRPLLNSQVPLSQEQLKIEFIGQDGTITNPIVQYSSLFQQSDALAVEKASNLIRISGISTPQWSIKLDQLELGDSTWPLYQFYQYWLRYYLSKNSIEGLQINQWQSLRNNVLEFESGMPANTLISALYQSIREFNLSLNHESFTAAKQAFLARVGLIDESTVEYQVLSSVYRLPIKNYVSQAIERLEFAEFSAYATSLISDPNPAIISSAKSAQELNDVQLRQLIQAQAAQ
ncbi:hypothetical protein [Kangiella sp. TOML190]|uniref:hypothetical protein n=1 Tax=Kangiella sp. TOML190 TaxID=2931351 RepID=UPI00203D2DD9|nr:hypothetical protein [Kangiella sp. TOML190]